MSKKANKPRCPECHGPLIEDIICPEDSNDGQMWWFCEKCRYYFSEPNFAFMEDTIIDGIDDDGEYYIRLTDSMKETFRQNRMKKRTMEADRDG